MFLIKNGKITHQSGRNNSSPGWLNITITGRNNPALAGTGLENAAAGLTDTISAGTDRSNSGPGYKPHKLKQIHTS